MAYWFRRNHRRWRRRRPTWRRRYRRWRRRWPRRKRRAWRRRRYGRRRRRRGARRRKVRTIRLFRRARKRTIKQWDPNAKTFCRIIGIEQALFWGINTQYRIMCDNQPWPIKTGEGEGGSMNLLQHTLWFLYNDNRLGKNRWTRSNSGFDLCRYHGTTFWFTRHPYISYIVMICRTGHFYLELDTYKNLHPEKMLHARKKIVIYSQQLRPRGKMTFKVHIPPPQLLNSQWYFQRDFCKKPLFTMLISAFDPVNNIIGGNQTNSSVLLYGFPYWSRPMPYDTYADYAAKCWGPQNKPWIDRKAPTAVSDKKEISKLVDPLFWETNTNTNQQEKWTPQDFLLQCIPLGGTHFGLNNTAILADYQKATTALKDNVQKTIAISLGRWKPQWPDDWSTADKTSKQEPFSYRYSWREDLGRGNQIMLYTRECREGIPEADEKLQDEPLYILANGYMDFIRKHSTHNPLNWTVVVFCDYTYPKMEGVIPVSRDWFKTLLKPGTNKAKNCTNATDKTLIKGWCNNVNDKQTKTNFKTADATLTQGCITRAPDVIDSEV
nr:ORF1 [Epsilontorquevirus sp.]